MTVTIRLAGSDDAKLLAELGARTFAETFGPDNTSEDMAAYLEANFSETKLAQQLAEPANRFLIAEIDGLAAGYAMLNKGQASQGVVGIRPLELRRIYAGAEWVGRGVGRALMETCLMEARGWGADVLWLGVWERNIRAIAFYEKWGFKKVGEHTFVLGSDPQADWIMALALDRGLR